ncbi:hypothetical protein HDU76_007148 [Blyttiomyces sp. JEL0837]|nr:hypothetical protein HDU76_007148 [Blyttiomyces sp. JEL0837]
MPLCTSLTNPGAETEETSHITSQSKEVDETVDHDSEKPIFLPTNSATTELVESLSDPISPHLAAPPNEKPPCESKPTNSVTFSDSAGQLVGGDNEDAAMIETSTLQVSQGDGTAAANFTKTTTKPEIVYVDDLPVDVSSVYQRLMEDHQTDIRHIPLDQDTAILLENMLNNCDHAIMEFFRKTGRLEKSTGTEEVYAIRELVEAIRRCADRDARNGARTSVVDAEINERKTEQNELNVNMAACGTEVEPTADKVDEILDKCGGLKDNMGRVEDDSEMVTEDRVIHVVESDSGDDVEVEGFIADSIAEQLDEAMGKHDCPNLSHPNVGEVIGEAATQCQIQAESVNQVRDVALDDIRSGCAGVSNAGEGTRIANTGFVNSGSTNVVGTEGFEVEVWDKYLKKLKDLQGGITVGGKGDSTGGSKIVGNLIVDGDEKFVSDSGTGKAVEEQGGSLQRGTSPGIKTVKHVKSKSTAKLNNKQQNVAIREDSTTQRRNKSQNQQPSQSSEKKGRPIVNSVREAPNGNAFGTDAVKTEITKNATRKKQVNVKLSKLVFSILGSSAASDEKKSDIKSVTVEDEDAQDEDGNKVHAGDDLFASKSITSGGIAESSDIGQQGASTIISTMKPEPASGGIVESSQIVQPNATAVPSTTEPHPVITSTEILIIDHNDKLVLEDPLVVRNNSIPDIAADKQESNSQQISNSEFSEIADQNPIVTNNEDAFIFHPSTSAELYWKKLYDKAIDMLKQGLHREAADLFLKVFYKTDPKTFPIRYGAFVGYEETIIFSSTVSVTSLEDDLRHLHLISEDSYEPLHNQLEAAFVHAVVLCKLYDLEKPVYQPTFQKYFGGNCDDVRESKVVTARRLICETKAAACKHLMGMYDGMLLTTAEDRLDQEFMNMNEQNSVATASISARSKLLAALGLVCFACGARRFTKKEDGNGLDEVKLEWCLACGRVAYCSSKCRKEGGHETWCRKDGIFRVGDVVMLKDMGVSGGKLVSGEVGTVYKIEKRDGEFVFTMCGSPARN